MPQNRSFRVLRSLPDLSVSFVSTLLSRGTMPEGKIKPAGAGFQGGPGGRRRNQQHQMKLSPKQEGWIVTGVIAFAVVILFNKFRSKLPMALQ